MVSIESYKIQPTKKDIENDLNEYTPLLERKNADPTTKYNKTRRGKVNLCVFFLPFLYSDGETLIHLLKASLGTGILAMPTAFKYSGLVLGVFASFFTAIICTHCSYILVKCAHILYKRTNRTAMTFAEVAETAFANGPKWSRRYAKFFRLFILQCLFLTHFGACSVYTVIIATNFQQIAEYYLGYPVNLRMCIALLLIPLIALSWIPNLKSLAPVSLVANLFIGAGLGITFYYLVSDLPPIEQRPMVGNLYALPGFFSITIFAIEAVGMVMPLENQMKTPQNFIGIFGVLNKGMTFVTFIYIFIGFLGFWRYGDTTAGSITLNLPIEELPAQAVKMFIALAVYCSFSLPFYVCLEIGWNSTENSFVKRSLLVNYVVRTLLVIAAVLLAVAVPTITPFIGLVGAFCFSLLGLLIPIAIEITTYWDSGFGLYNWMIYKNIIVLMFGMFAIIFGSKDAIEDIIELYTYN